MKLDMKSIVRSERTGRDINYIVSKVVTNIEPPTSLPVRRERMSLLEAVFEGVKPEVIPAKRVTPKEQRTLVGRCASQLEEEIRAIWRDLQHQGRRGWVNVLRPTRGRSATTLGQDIGVLIKVSDMHVTDILHTTSKGERLQLCPSPAVRGQLGVLACDVIKRRTDIDFYHGDIIDMIEADRREKTYDEEGLPDMMFNISGTNIVIYATRNGNVARYINYGCPGAANCEVYVPRDVKKNPRVIIRAMRDIQRHEELLYDYQLTGAQRTECKCGSSQCRGFVETGDDEEGEGLDDDEKSKPAALPTEEEEDDDERPVHKTRARSKKGG